jgi:hypothetical protein
MGRSLGNARFARKRAGARTESLGDPVRGVNVWERWMAPNPDGKTWDVLRNRSVFPTGGAVADVPFHRA